MESALSRAAQFRKKMEQLERGCYVKLKKLTEMEIMYFTKRNITTYKHNFSNIVKSSNAAYGDITTELVNDAKNDYLTDVNDVTDSCSSKDILSIKIKSKGDYHKNEKDRKHQSKFRDRHKSGMDKHNKVGNKCNIRNDGSVSSGFKMPNVADSSQNNVLGHDNNSSLIAECFRTEEALENSVGYIDNSFINCKLQTDNCENHSSKDSTDLGVSKAIDRSVDNRKRKIESSSHNKNKLPKWSEISAGGKIKSKSNKKSKHCETTSNSSSSDKTNSHISTMNLTVNKKAIFGLAVVDKSCVNDKSNNKLINLNKTPVIDKAQSSTYIAAKPDNSCNFSPVRHRDPSQLFGIPVSDKQEEKKNKEGLNNNNEALIVNSNVSKSDVTPVECVGKIRVRDPKSLGMNSDRLPTNALSASEKNPMIQCPVIVESNNVATVSICGAKNPTMLYSVVVGEKNTNQNDSSDVINPVSCMNSMPHGNKNRVTIPPVGKDLLTLNKSNILFKKTADLPSTVQSEIPAVGVAFLKKHVQSILHGNQKLPCSNSYVDNREASKNSTHMPINVQSSSAVNKGNNNSTVLPPSTKESQPHGKALKNSTHMPINVQSSSAINKGNNNSTVLPPSTKESQPHGKVLKLKNVPSNMEAFLREKEMRKNTSVTSSISNSDGGDSVAKSVQNTDVCNNMCTDGVSNSVVQPVECSNSNGQGVTVSEHLLGSCAPVPDSVSVKLTNMEFYGASSSTNTHESLSEKQTYCSRVEQNSQTISGKPIDTESRQQSMEERVINIWNIFQDDLLTAKCCRLSELLHLLIIDLKRKDDTLTNAKSLQTKELAEKEELKAEKEYKTALKLRKADFVPLFKTLIKKEKLHNLMYYQEIAIVLYCKIVDGLAKLKHEYYLYLYKCRDLIKTLVLASRGKKDDLFSEIFCLSQKQFNSSVDTIWKMLGHRLSFQIVNAGSHADSLDTNITVFDRDNFVKNNTNTVNSDHCNTTGDININKEQLPFSTPCNDMARVSIPGSETACSSTYQKQQSEQTAQVFSTPCNDMARVSIPGSETACSSTYQKQQSEQTAQVFSCNNSSVQNSVPVSVSTNALVTGPLCYQQQVVALQPQVVNWTACGPIDLQLQVSNATTVSASTTTSAASSLQYQWQQILSTPTSCVDSSTIKITPVLTKSKNSVGLKIPAQVFPVPIRPKILERYTIVHDSVNQDVDLKKMSVNSEKSVVTSTTTVTSTTSSTVTAPCAVVKTTNVGKGYADLNNDKTQIIEISDDEDSNNNNDDNRSQAVSSDRMDKNEKSLSSESKTQAEPFTTSLSSSTQINKSSEITLHSLLRPQPNLVPIRKEKMRYFNVLREQKSYGSATDSSNSNVVNSVNEQSTSTTSINENSSKKSEENINKIIKPVRSISMNSVNDINNGKLIRSNQFDLISSDVIKELLSCNSTSKSTSDNSSKSLFSAVGLMVNQSCKSSNSEINSNNDKKSADDKNENSSEINMTPSITDTAAPVKVIKHNNLPPVVQAPVSSRCIKKANYLLLRSVLKVTQPVTTLGAAPVVNSLTENSSNDTNNNNCNEVTKETNETCTEPVPPPLRIRARDIRSLLSQSNTDNVNASHNNNNVCDNSEITLGSQQESCNDNEGSDIRTNEDLQQCTSDKAIKSSETNSRSLENNEVMQFPIITSVVSLKDNDTNISDVGDNKSSSSNDAENNVSDTGKASSPDGSKQKSNINEMQVSSTSSDHEDDEDCILVSEVKTSTSKENENPSKSEAREGKKEANVMKINMADVQSESCAYKECPNFKRKLQHGTEILLCSLCNKVCYCSTKCQVDDWYLSHSTHCANKVLPATLSGSSNRLPKSRLSKKLLTYQQQLKNNWLREMEEDLRELKITEEQILNREEKLILRDQKTTLNCKTPTQRNYNITAEDVNE